VTSRHPQPQIADRWRRVPIGGTRRVLAVIGLIVAVLAIRDIAARAPGPEFPDADGAGAVALPAAASLTDAPERLLVQARGDVHRGREHALAALRQVRITSRALWHIRRRYVEPARIEPAKMLEAALQKLAHRVPEMLVDGTAAAGDLTVHIADASRHIATEGLTDLHQLSWRLLEAMRFVAAHLPDDVDASHVEYVGVNGMLATLDPYSYMLDPDQYRDMRTHTGGRFGGLGIRILTLRGVLTIVGVIEGSPAERAGLKENDQIVQIDGEDTLNMALDDAVDRLRGKVGAPARLMIRRKSWKKAREIVVVRAIIHLKSVESRVLDTGVGYARIKSFQRGTARELARTLRKLSRSGGRRGLVLDLRNNPGGLLDEAVKVCDLLLDGGSIVVTVEGSGQRRDERTASTDGTARKLPVIVLVNSRSASASEIVAGALKNTNRALVMGEQSFGKGTVQVPFEIGEGALKLTVAKYLVPGDVSIQDVGVTPDIALQFITAARRNTHLFDDRHKRPRKTWLSKEAPAPRPSHRLRIVLPTGRREGGESVARTRDREPIRRAARLLRHAGSPRADEMLTDAIPHIAEMQQADDRALTAELLRQEIDWRPGPRTATPRLSLQVKAPEGGFREKAGTTFLFPVEVRNNGRKPLYRVHVLTRSKLSGLNGHEAVVGKLEPGAMARVTVRARTSRRHRDARAVVRFVAAQDGNIRSADDRALVTIVAATPPDLRVRHTLDDSEASGDGLLQPKEEATLQVDIENVGAGEAGSLVATLRSLSGRRMHLEQGRVRLGKVGPGQRATARFQIRGELGGHGAQYADTGFLEATLTLRDERFGYQREVRLRVPWSRTRAAAAAPANRDRLARMRAVARMDKDRARHAPVILLHGEGEHRLGGGGLIGPLAPDEGSTGCTLQLRGRARFESGDPARRFVTVSVAGTKQSYTAGRGSDEVAFAARLRLDSGLNRVTIRARAAKELVSQRLLLVQCTADVARMGTP